MPANDFERQVQRGLEDFELNPSASVWKKVEEEIRKKKRRRMIAFFLLLAALMLTGYYFYYTNQNGSRQQASQQSIGEQGPVAKNEAPSNTGRDNTPQNVNEPVTPHRSSNEASPSSTPNEASLPNTATTNSDLQLSTDRSATTTTKAKDQQKKYNNPVTKDQDKTKTGPTITSQSNADLNVTVAIPATTVATGAASQKKVVDNNIGNDPKANQQIPAKEPVKAKQDTMVKDAAMTSDKPITLPKRKYRVKWGIDVFAGLASNQSQGFPLDISTSRNFSSSSAVGSPSTNRPSVAPSSIKSGPAFSIGVTSELQVSPRSRFSASLQYSYAGNRIRKGSVVYALVPVQPNSSFSNASADQVYHGSPQDEYINSYHFVSLPLEYRWQINRSKKLPIEWNNGIAFDYLLATNALIFNSSYGGIYYQDKKAISKLHFNIGTGLSFRLRSKNDMEWVIGPEIYFDTQRLIETGNDARQYLVFTGIDAKLLFAKKKNKRVQRSISK